MSIYAHVTSLNLDVSLRWFCQRRNGHCATVFVDPSRCDTSLIEVVEPVKWMHWSRISNHVGMMAIGTFLLISCAAVPALGRLSHTPKQRLVHTCTLYAGRHHTCYVFLEDIAKRSGIPHHYGIPHGSCPTALSVSADGVGMNGPRQLTVCANHSERPSMIEYK